MSRLTFNYFHIYFRCDERKHTAMVERNQFSEYTHYIYPSSVRLLNKNLLKIDQTLIFVKPFKNS